GAKGIVGGNAAYDYKRSGIPFQPSKRGAALLRPFFPFLKCPHTRGRRRSAIATMKLRLREGGNPIGLSALDGAGWSSPLSHPAKRRWPAKSGGVSFIWSESKGHSGVSAEWPLKRTAGLIRFRSLRE